MKRIYWISLGVIFLVLILSAVLIYQKNNLDPNSAKAYYKIFDKNEFLDGKEETADIVVTKLDKRLTKYKKTFTQMAGTNDDYKLKALFYMNFVHMFGVYGERTLKENTLKEIMWDSEYFHYGTNTLFLAMLLDKAGYEYRTVYLHPEHSLVEVKFDEKWQILGPTTNTWINKSVEELIAGEERVVKEFFLKATDQFNEKAHENIVYVVNQRDFMEKIGKGYQASINEYDHIKLSDYQY